MYIVSDAMDDPSATQIIEPPTTIDDNVRTGIKTLSHRKPITARDNLGSLARIHDPSLPVDYVGDVPEAYVFVSDPVDENGNTIDGPPVWTKMTDDYQYLVKLTNTEIRTYANKRKFVMAGPIDQAEDGTQQYALYRKSM